MSNGRGKAAIDVGILRKPGETESGSAAKQPEKGDPGRRCAKGASGPLAALASRGRFLESIGHRSHALENPACQVSLPQQLTAAHASVGRAQIICQNSTEATDEARIATDQSCPCFICVSSVASPMSRPLRSRKIVSCGRRIVAIGSRMPDNVTYCSG